MYDACPLGRLWHRTAVASQVLLVYYSTAVLPYLYSVHLSVFLLFAYRVQYSYRYYVGHALWETTERPPSSLEATMILAAI